MNECISTINGKDLVLNISGPNQVKQLISAVKNSDVVFDDVLGIEDVLEAVA